MRKTELFDNGWLFHRGDLDRGEPKSKGPIYTSAKTECMKWGPASIYYNDNPDDYRKNVEFNTDQWIRVDLPHDYIIGGDVKPDRNPALGFFEYDNAWYRKHFTVEEESRGRRLTLIFDGVATRCTVYLNGCELKNNVSAYLSFEVDITDFVNYGGDNVLAVYVRYEHNEGWWYQGGGIHRHVWLKKTDPVAVDLWGVFVRPEQEGDSDTWKVNFETTVRNDADADANVRVVSTVYDANGNACATAEGAAPVGFRSKAVVNYAAALDKPRRWDVDDPYMYTAETVVYVNGEAVDAVKDRFGFRSFRFTANDGFILNGRRVDIHGLCCHEDFGLTGKAVPDNIFRYKVKLMKEMGANGLRASHYPPATAMMDALDEAGFIVMDETRWYSSAEHGMEGLEMLLRRDRNHPCVFMWSIANEEPHMTTDVGRRISATMLAKVRQMDPSRPVTSAINWAANKVTIFDTMDLIGINYNLKEYDMIRAAYPNKPIFAAECCATGTTRGWYEEDSARYICAYDHDSPGNQNFTGREFFWKHFKARPWVFGEYQWIAFEHRGEAVWPRLCSQSGAIDLFLQKKDAFYQNQSLFSDRPMVHLLPHWNWEWKTGEEIRVVAYTNGDECELVLNGKSLGRKAIEPYGHGEWQVPFTPGRLEAVAYRNGKEVARDVRQTTGKAARLVLHLDNDTPSANGQDIAMITCTCVDEQGREMPDAAPFVHFDCNNIGAIVGTGSDITDHTPVPSTDRRMRAGRIGVAVRLGGNPGTLKVFARSEGLTAAQLSIEVK